MMKKKKQYNIAVVGARGAVGFEMCRILESRNSQIPVGELRLFASSRPAASPKNISFRGKDIPVQPLSGRPRDRQFDGIDIVLSSAGSAVSKQFLPIAKEAGCVVIDNTSAFRMEADVPLVIPEINPQEIARHKGVIANPNCSTIVMLMAVYPLYRANRIRRIVVSTYQSASGAGANAMRELFSQTREFLGRVENKTGQDPLRAIEAVSRDIQGSRPLKRKVFPHQIAFNLFSHNSPVADNGYNDEENKMVSETRKILADDQIQICPTAVRVPVFRAHAESILIEFEKKMTGEEARHILEEAQQKQRGIIVVDERKYNCFPMPFEASGKDAVFVGRIREDISSKNGIALFAAGDQLRKGAALNAVQIAEHLVK